MGVLDHQVSPLVDNRVVERVVVVALVLGIPKINDGRGRVCRGHGPWVIPGAAYDALLVRPSPGSDAYRREGHAQLLREEHS